MLGWSAEKFQLKKLPEEGEKYLIGQFMTHAKMTVIPACFAVFMIAYFEYPLNEFSAILTWVLPMLIIQFFRYYFSSEYLKNNNKKLNKRLFYWVNSVSAVWWCGYLFILGLYETNEALYLWRAFIVFILSVFYISVLRYSIKALRTYASIICAGILIYLIFFTLLHESHKTSYAILTVFGWISMLGFGRMSHNMACETYQLLAQNKKLIARLDDLLVHDELTNVHNRRYLNAELSRHIELFQASGEHFCLAIIDIDYFKDVNDKHGHEIGDKVLKSLSQYINSHMRNTDVFARYGGEEFCLILPKTTHQVARSVLQKLRQNIENHVFTFESLDMTLTVSIGMTVIESGDDENQILKRADLALYNAKESGRNKLCHS